MAVKRVVLFWYQLGLIRGELNIKLSDIEVLIDAIRPFLLYTVLSTGE